MVRCHAAVFDRSLRACKKRCAPARMDKIGRGDGLEKTHGGGLLAK